MTRFRRLVREAHRRSLWQVLGVYGAAGWVVLQVVEVLGETAGLPEWVGPASLVLLLLGLPVVLATAIVQDGVGGGPPQAADPPATGVAEPPEAIPAGRGEPAAEPAPTDPAPRSSPPRRAHWLFTWRNALLGGAAAFTLLAVVTGGWLTARAMGIGPAGTLIAKGVLEERGRILVADFENRTSDSVMARVVTEAVRVDLARSPAVRVAEPAFVSEALERMRQPSDTPLGRSLARDLAEREGIPAVLAGEIGALGGGYVLTAQLLASGSGEVLVSERTTASDSSRLLGAIDELSRALRERIGESLRTLRAEEPLERVTTPDLEALKRYSQGVRALNVENNVEKGVALLEEAVARDSAFAMAWRKLGTARFNAQAGRSGIVDAMERAFRHRDRLSPRERYMTEGTYHAYVTNETDRAVAAYESLLDLHPDDYQAMNNLAILYGQLRDYEREREILVRALELDSTHIHFSNLALSQAGLGELEEARRTLQAYEARFPGSSRAESFRALQEVAEGDLEAAASRLRSLRDRERGDPFLQVWTNQTLAAIAGARGRLAEAEAAYRAAADAEVERGQGGEALFFALMPAVLDLEVREDPAAALDRVEVALARHPPAALDPVDRQHAMRAEIYAAAGRPEGGRIVLEAFEAEVNPGLRERDRQAVARVRGHIAFAEGDTREAVEWFRRSDEGGCRHCALPGLAEAWERAGEADSALAVYERYVGLTDPTRIYWDAARLGPIYERLGQLYEARGDLEKARLYYAKLTELWAEADPELQPRVEAARAKLAALLEAGG